MMTTLRTQMKAILWILVVAFLGTIVFSWGMGGFKESQQPGLLTEFGGEKITVEAFEAYIQRKQEMAQRQDSTALDEAKIKQLREDAWDEEIERRLKEQDAKKQGVKVTDREIAYYVENYPPNEVRQVPQFQRDGQFAPDLYLTYLRTPDAGRLLFSLEASVKNYLLQQKIGFYVNQATDISEQLVRDEWARAGTKAKFRFAAIPFDKVAVDSTDITDEMLHKYYSLFPDRFKQYPQRRFVYVKFKLAPSGEDSTDTRRLTEELIGDLRRGADFAALARDHSEDPGSADKGGELDFFARGSMSKPFEDAAFNSPIGEFVGPVESKLGIDIIQVEEKKTEDGTEKVRARHILLKYKASPDTRDGVHSIATAFAQDAEQQGFDLVAQKNEYKVDSTKTFSEAGYIAGLGRMRMAAEFCFNNPVGTVSDVYPVPDGYVVFKILEATEEGVKPFNEARDAVQKAVLRIMKQQRAQDVAAKLRAKMTTGEDLSSQVAAAGYPVYESADSAKMDDRLPEGLRADKDFSAQVFRLNSGELSDVIEGKSGYYIAYMIYRTPFLDADYETNHFAIYGQLASRETDAVQKNWIRELRIAADIKDLRYKYFRDF